MIRAWLGRLWRQFAPAQLRGMKVYWVAVVEPEPTVLDTDDAVATLEALEQLVRDQVPLLLVSMSGTPRQMQVHSRYHCPENAPALEMLLGALQAEGRLW